MSANVLIMAGGTGGHVFPALACAREFEARGYTVHWLGTPRGIENDVVPKAGITLHHIPVTGLRGKGVRSLVKAPLQLSGALMQAIGLMRRLKPVCVLGLGGFVTGPGGLAAKLCNIPLVIHEQNAHAGTANRLLVPMAARVCEGFADTFPASAKRLSTGNPVRAELFAPVTRAPLEERAANLLVLGGSLGAEPLNKLLPEALAQLPAGLRPQVRHQAGRQHAEVTHEPGHGGRQPRVRRDTDQRAATQHRVAGRRHHLAPHLVQVLHGQVQLAELGQRGPGPVACRHRRRRRA